jgi:hypothetical protein
MTSLQKQNLLNTLKAIKKKPIEPEFGICLNVRRFTGFTYQKTLLSLFRNWKHYSGSDSYPVEGNVHKFSKQHNMFSKTTKYGRLRNNLLNFMIAKLSKELKKEGWDD